MEDNEIIYFIACAMSLVTYCVGYIGGVYGL